MKRLLFAAVAACIALSSSCKKEEVKIAPIADFTISKNAALTTESIEFTNKTTNAKTYNWNFDDGETSISESPTHTFANAGTYNVTLEAKGDGGTDKVTKTITIKSPPKYKLTLEVSYYFNQYQGYKPDVGASCKLYLGYVKSDTTSAHSYTVRSGKEVVYPITNGYGTIGVSGTYEYSNLLPGKYTIVVNSKGRYMYSEKQFELNSDLKLTHNFEYYNEYEHTPEFWR